MTYEDHFCDWLFEQGVDPCTICQLAFIELPEEKAEFDAEFLSEMGIAA